MRLRGGDRQQRRDAQRAEVEPLEDNRPGRDRACGREPERADGVGELGGGVGRLGLRRIELARELEHAEAVDVALEFRREQAARLGPEARDLTRDGRAHAHVRAELHGGAAREPDERRDGGVGPRRAEERSLDLGVRGVEGVVVPVEPAGPLGDGGQQGQQDRPEERVVRGRAHSRVGVREERGGRLAPEIVERVSRVREPA